MPSEPTIATGFRLPRDLYRDFKHKAVDRDVSVTEALRLAIREWIDKDASSEIQKWVGKLVQVLESRKPAAIRAVLSNLVAFSHFSAVDQEGSDSADSTIQAENEDIARTISNLRGATERAKPSPESHKERRAKTS